MEWKKVRSLMPSKIHGEPVNKRRSSKKLFVVILAFIALFSGICYGNWEDDWISSYTASGPSYIQGNQRGYFSGGSFSARWPSTSDHLLTVSVPRLKTGCGGVDLFLGGMSFMNVNYLVQKLQNIMSAAPAAAFDIALKTLCPQCSDTIKSLEAIADRLNQLQLDDCKASKAMVAAIASPFVSDTKVQGDLSTSITDFMQSSGVSNLYTDVEKDIGNVVNSAQGNKPTANNDVQTSSAAMTAGCPADYLAIFGGGSVLDNLATVKGIDLGYVMMMRGFIGDVWVDAPATTGATFVGTYVSPCDKNKNIQNFFAGDISVKSTGTSAGCTDVTDANRNLYQYTSDLMTSIAGKMKSGTALGTAELNFANTLSLTIMPMLQAAVASGTDGMVIGQLSDIAAKEYAYAMLTDLFARNTQMILQAHTIQSATNGSAAGNNSNTCILTQFKGVEAQLQSLEDNLHKVMADLRTELIKSADDLNALQGVADNMRKMNEIVEQELGKRFGQGIATHVRGG
jgi:conjugative transfer pilus assembly protein TraH